MIKSKRWVLLEHTGAPDDLLGIHFDLLLEDISYCWTWRLTHIPNQNSPEVEAIRLPNHDLRWLDINESILSKGRGHVKQIDGGVYEGCLPEEEDTLLQIEILGNSLSGYLQIEKRICRILPRKYNHSL